MDLCSFSDSSANANLGPRYWGEALTAWIQNHLVDVEATLQRQSFRVESGSAVDQNHLVPTMVVLSQGYDEAQELLMKPPLSRRTGIEMRTRQGLLDQGMGESCDQSTKESSPGDECGVFLGAFSDGGTREPCLARRGSMLFLL